MKPSLSVTSSDLERARESAERLVAATPGQPVAPPEKPPEYVRFSASALGVATAPRPTPPPRPTAAPAPPRAAPPAPPMTVPAPPPGASRVAPPGPSPFAAEPPWHEPPPAPALRHEPAARAAMPPPAPPAPTTPHAVVPHKAVAPQPPPPRPEPAAPLREHVFEIDDIGEPEPEAEPSDALAAAADEALGAIEDEEPSPPEPAFPPSPPAEFEDDISDVAAAAVGVAVEPAPAEPPPSWGDILDDAIYLAHARCALVMDGAGQVHESRGDWPKNTIEKVAARLLKGIETAPPLPNPDATQLIEIQLGSFFLTGLRVGIAGRPAIVGFLSQAPIQREARSGVEAEVKRGAPL